MPIMVIIHDDSDSDSDDDDDNNDKDGDSDVYDNVLNDDRFII